MKNQAFSDQSTALISIASNASLDAFAEATNTKPDSRRFRINIIIDGDTPFAEETLVGKTLRCGDALLLVKDSVGRCAAINVDPATANRNQDDYVRFMKAHFGHSNLGIFAEVINGGIAEVDCPSHPYVYRHMSGKGDADLPGRFDQFFKYRQFDPGMYL